MKRKPFKRIGSVMAGLVLIFALSILTDTILEKTGAMKLPFSDNPLWLMLVVTLYRNIYVAMGAYLTAALAPDRPMRHAMILAGIGCVLGIMGTIMMWHLPPHWYPISLVILGWPFSWLGARYFLKRKRA